MIDKDALEKAITAVCECRNSRDWNIAVEDFDEECAKAAILAYESAMTEKRQAEYDSLMAMLDNPPPPSEELIRLMTNVYLPWKRAQDERTAEEVARRTWENFTDDEHYNFGEIEMMAAAIKADREGR